MTHEFKPGDTFSVSTWGRLPKQELAQNGLEVLMGVLSACHANCRWPNHFWCAPPEETVSAVAEIYGDYVRIIAQLPILPDPTPLEILDIKGLAPK